MMQQSQSELDLLQAEECVARKAHLVLLPDVVGHIISVHVTLGCRAYTFEWFFEGLLYQNDFYGFQLAMED